MTASPLESTAPAAAFTSDDELAIIGFAANAQTADMPCAIVTLVDIRGGSARALGAQMAVCIDGRYCGYVSGGCTESAVAAEAVSAIQSGHDRFLKLGAGSPFFDIQLPCGGGITLFIHVVRPGDPLDQIKAKLQGRERVSLVLNTSSESASLKAGTHVSGWDNEHFIRGYLPRVKLVIIGDSIEAMTTAELGVASGFEVDLRDPKAPVSSLSADIDSDTAVALLQHGFRNEVVVLRDILQSDAFYIGALGSTRTNAIRCQALIEVGLLPVHINRLIAPIGIFPKARTASAVALSVLGQIVAIDRQALLAS